MSKEDSPFVENTNREENMKKTLSCALFLTVILASVIVNADTSVGPNQEILLDGKPFFPIMVWLQPTKNIAMHKELGINTFSGHGANGESPKDYLDACEKAGVYAAVSADSIGVDEVKKLKDHKALLFWWMPDEPDQMSNEKKGPAHSPDEIIAIYKKVKAIDTKHIVGCTFTTFQAQGSPQIRSSYFPQYMPGMDMIGFDTYPVSDGRPERLDLMAKGMQILNKYDKGSKPHFVWVENTKIHDKKGRAPTPYEMRAQIWMCVVHGARSIGYFPHSWDNGKYSQSRIPEDLKSEMRRVNKQLTDLGAVITSATSKIEVTAETKDDSSVDTLVKEGDGKVYIFTSNRKNKPGETVFTVKGLAAGEVEVYGEGRKLNMAGGKFTDKFKEFEPHIYVIKK